MTFDMAIGTSTERDVRKIAETEIRQKLGYGFKSQTTADIREIGDAVVPDWDFLRDGRFGFWQSCIGPDPTTDNPYGFRQNQWNSLAECETFFDGVYTRAESFFASHGYARVVWRTFPGRIDGILGNMGIFEPPSADDPTGPNINFSGRVQAFLERTQEYKETTDGRGTVGFYVGGQVPVDLAVLEDDQTTADWERYDHDDLGHRRVMFHEMLQHAIDTMKPYDLYPNELWFDNTSPSDWRSEATKLVRHLRDKWGIHGGGEAIPVDLRVTKYALDYSAIQRAPWQALWRFIASRDPDSEWIIPDNAELGLLMQDSSEFGNPTEAVMQARVEQGFVLWSTQTSYDTILSNLADLSIVPDPPGAPYSPETGFIAHADSNDPWDD